jgi:N-methylhydantoinase B
VRDGTVERRGRVAHVSLEEGQVVRSVTGTGGGFGDPRERDPERVRDDVRDGYVTIECAREIYAVALDPETLEVDAAGTAGLRSG